jgi:hypothetical protein
MAKSGDWGGDKAALKNSVTRTGFTKHETITRDDSKPVQGPAPKLKVYSEPWYDRQPFDSEFKNLNAKGSDDYGHGQ